MLQIAVHDLDGVEQLLPGILVQGIGIGRRQHGHAQHVGTALDAEDLAVGMDPPDGPGCHDVGPGEQDPQNGCEPQVLFQGHAPFLAERCTVLGQEGCQGDVVRCQFLEQCQVFHQIVHLFIGSPYQESCIRLIPQILQIVHTVNLGGKRMGGGMEPAEMERGRGHEAEEVPLGPGLVQPMVGFLRPFPHRKAQGAVGEFLLQVGQNIAQDHIRIVMILSPFQHKGSDPQLIAQGAGPPDLFPVQPEAVEFTVLLPAGAVRTVLGAVVAEFQHALEVHPAVEHIVHGLLGTPEQFIPQQRVLRLEQGLILLVREYGIFLQLVHQIHNAHPSFRCVS